jgi:hypothetical protein
MGNTTVEITVGVATTVSPAPLPGAPLPVVTSPAPVVGEKVVSRSTDQGLVSDPATAWRGRGDLSRARRTRHLVRPRLNLFLAD